MNKLLTVLAVMSVSMPVMGMDAISNVLEKYDNDIRSQQILREDPAVFDPYEEINKLNNELVDLRVENKTLKHNITSLISQLDEKPSDNAKYTAKDLYLAKTQVKLIDLMVFYNTLKQYIPHLTDDAMISQTNDMMGHIEKELAKFDIDPDDIALGGVDLGKLLEERIKHSN